MIPVDVLNSLKSLLLTQKQLPQVAAATAATPAFELGQKLQAKVQAQMAPGIFKVRVADQLMQLQLPNTIRAGDTIILQVASLLPRLTFSMAASANPLSTADQLSATARLLSSLTQQPLEKSFLRPTNSAPLWAGVTQFPDTTELAGKLHTTISQSGLFYESHQAQWLAGSRNTAQLLQEPQNLPAEQVKAAFDRNDKTPATNTAVTPNYTNGLRNTTQILPGQQYLPADPVKAASAHDDRAPSLNTETSGNPATVATAQDDKAPSMNTATITAASGNAATVATAQERISIPGIPDHLQPLIQQQLNALETRQVQWQGQVWPNQEMNWKIREEATHSPPGSEGRQWATQIHLDLPNLGEVTATLRFDCNGLSVTLDTDTSATRAKLGTASSTLVAALSERGITITSALVTLHDDTRQA